VVRKAENQVVRHIEAGDKTHKPRVPKVKATKIKEAAQELAADAKGQPAKDKPWEPVSAARQRHIRTAWLNAADALDHPKPTLTFNNQEQRNERPDYNRIDDRDIQRGQRAVALYQSHLKKTGPAAPPYPVAGLRNLSAVHLVQHERSSKVLLPANASDRMGRKRAADTDLRRPGIGDPATTRTAKQLDLTEGSTADNKALAARIRAFVEAMPVVETERQALKRDLSQKFTKAAEQVHQPAAPELDPSGPKKGADKSAPNPVRPGKKEIER
jgi:hypothetical protein